MNRLFDDDEPGEDPDAPSSIEIMPPCRVRSPWCRLNAKSIHLLNQIRPLMRDPGTVENHPVYADHNDRITLLALGRVSKANGMTFVVNEGVSLHFYDYGDHDWTLTGGTIGMNSNAEIQEAAEAILECFTNGQSLFPEEGKRLCIWSPYAKDDTQRRIYR